VHIVRLIVVIEGRGFTDTVNVNGLPDWVNPEQAPKEGVMEYTAVCCTLVLLVSVPVILVVALIGPDTVNDEVEAGKFQLYAVPTGTIPLYPSVVGVGVTTNAPAHIVVLNAGTDGLGSICTSTKKLPPTQLPA
jgi:hypothetical protein